MNSVQISVLKVVDLVNHCHEDISLPWLYSEEAAQSGYLQRHEISVILDQLGLPPCEVGIVRKVLHVVVWFLSGAKVDLSNIQLTADEKFLIEEVVQFFNSKFEASWRGLLDDAEFAFYGPEEEVFEEDAPYEWDVWRPEENAIEEHVLSILLPRKVGLPHLWILLGVFG